MTKPTLFIASSVEGLRVADAINVNLEHETHCTIWRNGTFKLSSQTVDDLVKKSSTIDFAVFVFTPDDIAKIRKQEEIVARDNVVFELGLFIGAIGKERCYVVKPRGIDMHLPSDLLGMNPADYATDRPDDDIASALNFACKQIKDRIAELGPINRLSLTNATSPVRVVANPRDYKLHDADLLFLTECVKSQVSRPDGLSFLEIRAGLSNTSEPALMMSAIKLHRLGYIEKSIEQEQQGYGEYFSYRSTDDGLDVFLKNEDRLIELRKPVSRASHQRNGRAVSTVKASGFEDMNDDIPF